MNRKKSISVILNSLAEIDIIKKSIEAILPQLTLNDELVIISPDFPMKSIVESYKKQFKNISWIKDQGVGKPESLNLGFAKVKSDILVLTDGDVYIEDDAIKNLVKYFDDEQVGAVTGRPLSLNDKNNIFGFWSHYLTTTAHQIRLMKDTNSQFMECSGYLYAFRNGLIKSIPSDALSEDALITHMIADKNFKIRYSPEALVYVKYPNTFKDWIKQKVRSSGGYTQKYITKFKKLNSRSFFSESFQGLKVAITYPKNIKEIFWLALLFLARLYMWLLVVAKVHILKQSRSTLWPRILSTK